jgi:hypothetical protein
MPSTGEGGNRERLKQFLVEVEGAQVDIRGLVDSDHRIALQESLPQNAWATDFRDAEGYVLAPENVEAAMRLGCGIERASVASICSEMVAVARYLAAIRLASVRIGLRLPVSSVRLSKFVTSSRDGVLRLDRERLILALLQAAGLSGRNAATVATEVDRVGIELSSLPDDQIVHGKDALKILGIQFRALGAPDLTDVSPILWATFRRDKLSEFPVLSEVVDFLTKG